MRVSENASTSAVFTSHTGNIRVTSSYISSATSAMPKDTTRCYEKAPVRKVSYREGLPPLVYRVSGPVERVEVCGFIKLQFLLTDSRV